MQSRKRRCAAALLAVSMMFTFAGCGQKNAAAPEAKKSSKIHLERAEAAEAIYGNGGHFVEYNGKTWFLSPGDDSMQTAALWGSYELADGKKCNVAAYDPKAQQSSKTQWVDYPFEGAYYGKFVISGGRLVLGAADEAKNPFVCSVNMDGKDLKRLPGAQIYGTDPSGEHIITGGHKGDKFHFYVCRSDGSYDDIKFGDKFIHDYAGMSGGYAFFVIDNSEKEKSLMGYNLKTGESAVYGVLPKIPNASAYSNPALPKQLYTEDGYVYMQLCAYEGTGNFYVGSSFVRAKCDEAGSLEKIFPFPKNDSKTASKYASDTAPVVAVIGGKLVYVDGVPGTAAVNDGNVGIYDKDGVFVKIAEGYGDSESPDGESRTHTELCENVGSYIYLVRNVEQRSPEDDIGWRMAYKRLKTYICRIDKKTGEAKVIDYIENPAISKAR